jgi:hypothetical protein
MPKTAKTMKEQDFLVLTSLPKKYRACWEAQAGVLLGDLTIIVTAPTSLNGAQAKRPA